MSKTSVAVARLRGIVLFRTSVDTSERSCDSVSLVNLGTTPVFVHDGVLDLGDGLARRRTAFTGREEQVLLPGGSVELLPLDMFESLAQDPEDRERLRRALVHAGVVPLHVRLTFGDGEAVVMVEVGSLEQLLRDPQARMFDFYSGEFVTADEQEA